MAWLSGWKYRKSVTISGSTGAGTNYQVPLNVGESSGATGYDFHLNGHSASFPSDKNQGGDLRFTSSDGSTLLDFWVESVSGTSPNRVAKIWVEVSADLGSNQFIYCYYGNPSATNSSNGVNTFLFFDDFEGTSLDTNKWPGYQGNISVGSSIVTLSPASPCSEIRGSTSFARTLAFRSKMKIVPVSYTNYNSGLWGVDSNTVGGVDNANISNAIMWGFAWQDKTKNASYVEISNKWYFVADTTNHFNDFYIWEFRWLTDKVNYYINDTYRIQQSQNLNVNLYPRLKCTSDTGQYTYADWILIRKCIATEPVFSSAGSEETPPAFLLFFN